MPRRLLILVKLVSEIPNAMDELLGSMISAIVGMSLVAPNYHLSCTSLIIEEKQEYGFAFQGIGYRFRETRSLILDSSTICHSGRVHNQHSSCGGHLAHCTASP